MTKQNKDYSSIKSHKDLLKAISDIDQEIKLQTTQIDSSLISIKYKYSFAHLMEIAVTRYQIIAKAINSILLLIKKIKKNNIQLNEQSNENQ